MSDLDAFFSINVTATTETQTRTGFGTPLFAVAKVPWTSGARVRSYASTTEMATAGFATTDPAYRMAASAFAQEPRPAVVKIGQRTRLFTQIVRMIPATPVDPAAAETYAVKVAGLTCTFTTDATPTAAEAATGLAAAVNASALGADADAIIATGASSGTAQSLTADDFDGVLGGETLDPPRRLSLTLSNNTDWDASELTVTGTNDAGAAQTEVFTIPNNGNATVNGTKHFRTITGVAVGAQTGSGGTFTLGTRAVVVATTDSSQVVCTAQVAGRLVSYELTAVNPATENVSLLDVTADPGIEADLNELLAVDPDFYGLALDSNSQDEIEAVAPWAQTNRRIFVWQSADTGCGVAGTTDDVMSVLQAASNGYAPGWHYPAIAMADGWFAAGMLGNRLPRDPGSDTWAYKTVAGITVRAISTAARAAVLAKNGNVYERRNGVNVTFPGKVPLGEWIDTVRGLDWQRARMKEALFALQTANEKVAYTDDGIGLMAAAIFGVLEEGVARTFYAANPKPVVRTPLAAATSSSDRSARALNGVTFSARLAGAIHTGSVTGTATI